MLDIMNLDPLLIQWALILTASWAAFMIGMGFAHNAALKKQMDLQEEIIETTILFLINNNFVRSRLVNGEHEIIRIDEEE